MGDEVVGKAVVEEFVWLAFAVFGGEDVGFDFMEDEGVDFFLVHLGVGAKV